MIPGLCSAFYQRPGQATGSFSAITDISSTTTFGNGMQTSQIITAAPVGGVGPYTYTWSIDGAATLTAPAAAATSASLNVGTDDYSQNNARCVITDSTAATAQTPDVAFIFQWTP